MEEGKLTAAAIHRAVREFEEGESVILYVSPGQEEVAKRAIMPTVRPQPGDKRTSGGAHDAMVEGRRVTVQPDPGLVEGEWGLSEEVGE